MFDLISFKSGVTSCSNPKKKAKDFREFKVKMDLLGMALFWNKKPRALYIRRNATEPVSSLCREKPAADTTRDALDWILYAGSDVTHSRLARHHLQVRCSEGAPAV